MNRKKILIVNYNMIVGGSTTSLISFLNNIDKSKYDIDLLLYKNEGPLFEMIPKDINILKQAFKYEGIIGKLLKGVLGIVSGYLLRAKRENAKLGVLGYSEQVMADFQAIYLSRKLDKQYDIAIGFMEGWSDRYVAYRISANKKYGWLHSTFNKIAPIPNLEKNWMDMVDKVICVSENCREDFCNIMKDMKSKSLTIENIVDSGFIRAQSQNGDESDEVLNEFKNTCCFKIVSICRLSIETKGLDRIVKVAKQLVDEGYDFRWYIVGDGADEHRLVEMINSNDLNNYVKLTGKRINPYPFLVTADVMCMPSRWEGKPMSVVESMILGTPCIVTDYLSAREQIKDKEDGIIVKNNDESIYFELKKCMDNNEYVQKMRECLKKNEYGNVKYIKYIEQKLFEDISEENR